MLTQFKVELAATIHHYTIEVPPDLLSWMDAGGVWDPGEPWHEDNPTLAYTIGERFRAVKHIEPSSVEYNGHYGPYVYFACDADKASAVVKEVLTILRDCNSRMRRSRAYKLKSKATNACNS